MEAYNLIFAPLISLTLLRRLGKMARGKIKQSSQKPKLSVLLHARERRQVHKQGGAVGMPSRKTEVHGTKVEVVTNESAGIG